MQVSESAELSKNRITNRIRNRIRNRIKNRINLSLKSEHSMGKVKLTASGKGSQKEKWSGKYYQLTRTNSNLSKNLKRNDFHMAITKVFPFPFSRKNLRLLNIKSCTLAIKILLPDCNRLLSTSGGSATSQLQTPPRPPANKDRPMDRSFRSPPGGVNIS